MAVITPLSMVSADHFYKVQQATARKLIDTAVARTGTAQGDWVVRPFVLDGGTGPTSQPPTSQSNTFTTTKNKTKTSKKNDLPCPPSLPILLVIITCYDDV